MILNLLCIRCPWFAYSLRPPSLFLFLGVALHLDRFLFLFVLVVDVRGLDVSISVNRTYREVPLVLDAAPADRTS